MSSSRHICAFVFEWNLENFGGISIQWAPGNVGGRQSRAPITCTERRGAISMDTTTGSMRLRQRVMDLRLWSPWIVMLSRFCLNQSRFGMHLCTVPGHGRWLHSTGVSMHSIPAGHPNKLQSETQFGSMSCSRSIDLPSIREGTPGDCRFSR